MIAVLQFLGLAEKSCVACERTFVGKDQGFVCEECLDSIRAYHPMDYSLRLSYVSSYRIFGLYEGPLKEVIHCIKFHKSKVLAIKLGQIIRGHLWEYVEEVNPDAVSFPSLNLVRFWNRGFNHVEQILKSAQVPCLSLFERRDIAPPLARLSKEERSKAVMGYKVRNAFADFVENKNLLIVDDLLTTGSTIQRLAYLLLSLGAQEVHAYFIARS
ncbi:MAG: ComF family protein [Aquificaceae bacterium]